MNENVKHSVYGTAYNSVRTVEGTIRSVFRPDYEIVIVDSFSEDGTYEKLLQLRQDFNLTVLRLRCSRGRGRDHALRHCQDGAMTAFIDLDVEYNENFHRLMLAETSGTAVNVGQWTFFAKKEDAIERGGWEDMNNSEDLGFFLRNGVAHTVPAVVGYNEPGTGREKRYATGLRHYRRIANKMVCRIRADGLRFSEVNPVTLGIAARGSLRSGLPAELASKGLYFLAAIRGITRFEKDVDNRELFFRKMVETAEDPKRFGIADSDVLFPYQPSPHVPLPDERLAEKWGSGQKFTCSNGLVFYVKSPDALQHLGRMPEYRCESPTQTGRFG